MDIGDASQVSALVNRDACSAAVCGQIDTPLWLAFARITGGAICTQQTLGILLVSSNHMGLKLACSCGMP